MQVFFGTVVRNAPVQRGGELVRLDWHSKTVTEKIPVAPVNPSLEEAPAHRRINGCRGIAFYRDRLIAASYHTLSLYDLRLRHSHDITHNLMAGLHEIASDGDGKVWVGSTALDAALEIDVESGEVVREFWPRGMSSFQKALGLTPSEIDKRADNRARFVNDSHIKSPSYLHLNAVAEWQGEVFALFNRLGVIANLSAGEVAVKDPALVGAHNLLFLEDGTAIVNGTLSRTVRFYDLRSGNLVDSIDLREFPWVRALRREAMKRNLRGREQETKASYLFVRGLDRLGDWLFVGLSPASILCLGWRKKEFVDAFTYSHDVQVCVHGLKVMRQ